MDGNSIPTSLLRICLLRDAFGPPEPPSPLLSWPLRCRVMHSAVSSTDLLIN
uniref:Uncharacterized protein n=1 Tax=Arundo donax TaxID=35708 RepID=A0A0A9C7K8_ARUDO